MERTIAHIELRVVLCVCKGRNYRIKFKIISIIFAH